MSFSHHLYQFTLRKFVLGVTVLISAVASAADKPRVVVVPLTAGEGTSAVAADKFSALVVDELKLRTETLEVASNPAVKGASADKPVSGGKRGLSAEAVNALDAGKKAFDDLRFSDAAPSLKKGIDGMLADPASADFEGVVDAQVKLAVSYFRIGEERAAKQVLTELVSISPSFELPAGYPPVFQLEFQKAKKRVEKMQHGTITVDGPPGATAFVDGRDLGMVPVVDENLAAGPHFIKVEGTKGERFGQVVDLKGPSVKVKAAFGNAPGEGRMVMRAGEGPVENPNISVTVDDATLHRMAEYTKAANADFALVGYVYKSSETELTAGTALYSAKKNAFSVLAPVVFDTDVVTANTEVFKLADLMVKQMADFVAVSLPVRLATQIVVAEAVSAGDSNPDDVNAAVPSRQSKKIVLVPESSIDPVSDNAFREGIDGSAPPPERVEKAKVPVWVWVVVGAAVVAGAGVGGYYGISYATKPVSGTVNATW